MKFERLVHKKGYVAVLLTILVLVVTIVWLGSHKPSHARDWEMGHGVLPRIIIEDDLITIQDLRDFEWTGSFTANENYITDTFDLSELQTLDVVISHFSEFEGMAHIFLSFGFTDNRHVSISLETRRESDEEFSPWLGILRAFEIIYVVGTDRDVIGIRTGYRDERVYIYPTVATPEQAQALFVRLAENINAVYAQPTFYNTLTHNCTNELTRAVEDISDYDFPLTYRALFPGLFDKTLYDMGLLEKHGTFEETKASALVDNSIVDERDPDYTTKVRIRK